MEQELSELSEKLETTSVLDREDLCDRLMVWQELSLPETGIDYKIRDETWTRPVFGEVTSTVEAVAKRARIERGRERTDVVFDPEFLVFGEGTGDATLAGLRPWTTGEVPPRIAVADLAAPGELLERARTALRAADPTRAAVDLAVVLRLEPGLAPAILDLLARSPRAGPSPAAAALELVRGDAYRLTGRSAEAEDAYTAAAHLAAPSPGEPAPGTGKEEL